jgi:hypothetical protein
MVLSDNHIKSDKNVAILYQKVFYGRIPIFPVIQLLMNYASLPSVSGSSSALIYNTTVA